MKRKEMEFIINHSPAVVWLWKATAGWPVEYVSDNLCNFGYTPDDFTSSRITYTSIIHPDDLPGVADEVEKYTNEGKTDFTQEYRILTKSGEIRWIDDRTWVRRGADGSVTHYQGIIVDITERKRAEEALHLSEKHMKAIVDVLLFPNLLSTGNIASFTGTRLWRSIAVSSRRMLSVRTSSGGHSTIKSVPVWPICW